jgi:small-conductance mechanosensitive channel
MSYSEIRESISQWFQGLGLSTIVISLIAAAAATVLFLVALKTTGIVFRRIHAVLDRWQQTRVRPLRYQQQEILSAEEITRLIQGTFKALKTVVMIVLFAIFLMVLIALLPFTQHIAVSTFELVFDAFIQAGEALLAYIPELIQILVIVFFARYLIKLAELVFNGIETERIRVRGFFPDWARPTFKITRMLMIALAAVVIIPLLPGASSPAFKGVSIFLGALLSLGSTGAVSNLVSGTVITYMRSFQPGDFVRIADTKGQVIKRTMFVTKLKSPKNVIIAIPNSMILANHIVNYSELAKNRGVILHTAITIGYDVPWRQVHDLLISSAAKTERIAEDPAPFVLQTALNDFYVTYELNAYTEDPIRMSVIYSDLHAHIQDAFNDAGLEIMSPHYSALRDGNRTAIPDDYLPKDYRTPAIRLNPLDKILPGSGSRGDE